MGDRSKLVEMVVILQVRDCIGLGGVTVLLCCQASVEGHQIVPTFSLTNLSGLELPLKVEERGGEGLGAGG